MRSGLVFTIFWLALFLLYFPSATSGWVSDTLGWLQAVRTQSFSDFISRKGFGVPSFYQLTQAVTWSFYQLFRDTAWAWHLLHLSLHAINATLLFTLLRSILRDSKLAQATPIAFITAALFSTSPDVSEVIVWEASFHFLQGLLLILLQLHFLHRHLHDGKTTDALLSIILYTLSLFSLELFYLTSFLGLSLCIYYRLGLQWQPVRTRQSILRIVLPQIALLAIYLISIRLFFNIGTGRLGNALGQLPLTYYLVKPPEYLFHLLDGRFLPTPWRATVYQACSSYVGAAVFYLSIAALVIYILLRFRRMSQLGMLMSLAITWLLLGIVLVSPLWFPQRLLITADRYLYILLPPFFFLVVLAIYKWIPKTSLQTLLIFLLIVLHSALTLKLNNIWSISTALTDKLQHTLRGDPGKITILLNNPASLQGAPMIGAGDDDEALLMHNLRYPTHINNPVHDALAMHLLHVTDGVEIHVVDPQTIRVSLTQPGSFWQYGPDIARSYAMSDYSVIVDKDGCCYTLNLNSHPSTYRLLYQQSGEWHELRFTDY